MTRISGLPVELDIELISMGAMGIPMYLLYEGCIVLGRILKR